MICVWCLDDNYKQYAELSIKTVKKFNPKAKIVVVSEKPIEVEGADKYFVFNLGGQHRNRGVGDRISNAAYLKLLLTNLPYNKVIFIDGDVLCQGSLDELWDTNVDYIGLCESHSIGKKQAAELGLKRYGLSGMLLLNLVNLRKINFIEESFKFEKENTIPDIMWRHEETVINCRWTDKLTFLPIKFNYCHNRRYNNPIPENEAVLLHIVGKDKSFMFKYK